MVEELDEWLEEFLSGSRDRWQDIASRLHAALKESVERSDDPACDEAFDRWLQQLASPKARAQIESYFSSRVDVDRIQRNACALVATAAAARAAVGINPMGESAFAKLTAWAAKAVGAAHKATIAGRWQDLEPARAVRTVYAAYNRAGARTQAAEHWTLLWLNSGPPPVRTLKIPLAGAGPGGGFLADLHLWPLKEDAPCLIEHPEGALEAFDEDLQKAIGAAAAGMTNRKSVCWSVLERTDTVDENYFKPGKLDRTPRMALLGDSLGAAAAVAFRLLDQDLPYDAGCLITATVKLTPIEKLDVKLDAAARGNIRRVGIAKDQEVGPKLEAKAARLEIELVRLADIDQAVEFATGRVTRLRRLAEGEIRVVLEDASRRLDRTLNDWPSFDGLFVPLQMARGLRPRLSEAEYEELERRRRAGDFRQLNELERQRIDLRDPRMQVPLERPRPTVPWERVRESIKRSVVLGDPGFGKTMVLCHEVCRRNYALLEKIAAGPVSVSEARFAVFVRAIEIADALPGLPGKDDLVGSLVARLMARHGLRSEDRELVRAKLENGDVLIALDALDEVPQQTRDRLNEALKFLASHCPESRLLLSSRLVGYTRAPVPVAEQDELEVLAFDESRMRKAVEAWFASGPETGNRLWEHIRARRGTYGDLRCPLLLRLACQAAAEARRKGRPLPQWERRGELYEIFLMDAVSRWAERAKPGREAAGLLFPFASDVALALWLRDPRRTLWDQTTMSEVVNSARGAYHALAKRSDLASDLCDAGILVPAGPDDANTPLMFTHRSFGEYLAGRALARRLRDDDPLSWHIVDKKAWDPQWQQVLVFCAGQLGADELADAGG